MTAQRIPCLPVVRALRVYTSAGRVVIGVLDYRSGGSETEVSRVELEPAEANVLAVQLHNAVTQATAFLRTGKLPDA